MNRHYFLSCFAAAAFALSALFSANSAQAGLLNPIANSAFYLFGKGTVCSTGETIADALISASNGMSGLDEEFSDDAAEMVESSEETDEFFWDMDDEENTTGSFLLKVKRVARRAYIENQTIRLQKSLVKARNNFYVQVNYLNVAAMN